MKMTGDVFKDLIEANPNWCKDLKEKTSITTYADLSNSNITQLSPLLTFTAKKRECKNVSVNWRSAMSLKTPPWGDGERRSVASRTQ